MTTIQLANYDLSAARARLQARVSRERGLVYYPNGDVDYDYTHAIRDHFSWNHSEGLAGWVWSQSAGPVEKIRFSLMHGLESLPVELGGTAELIPGGWAANIANVTPDKPLVQALLVLRAHPCHGPFKKVILRRTETPGIDAGAPKLAGGPEDAGPMLEALYQADPPAWDLRRLEQLVFEGAKQYCGDLEIDDASTPDFIYPGALVHRYMGILGYTFLYDAIGAFDPAFSRRDALVGEWWLLQPVSPRLDHRVLADRFGLQLAGFLPQTHVDAPGRVVMASYPRVTHDDAYRGSLIDNSKWIAGWHKVVWSKDRPPLDDPKFDLVILLEGVTEDSYGPFRHASDLPLFPPR